MKKLYPIKEAIKISTELLLKGAVPDYLLLALVADGFSSQRAETIVSWAYMQASKELDDIVGIR